MPNSPLALPHLIGLLGLSGSGKDLVAALLAMLGYQYLSLAHGLRHELEQIAKSGSYGSLIFPPKELESLPPTHLARHGWLRIFNNPNSLWTKPTEPSIRILLQWYGTDYRRNQDPDYWLNIWHNSYQTLQKLAPSLSPDYSGPLPLVVPDVRFENEAKLIHDLGGHLYLVHKPYTKPLTHSSENPELLKDYTNLTLTNSGTQTQLAQQLLTHLFGLNPHRTLLSKFDFD